MVSYRTQGTPDSRIIKERQVKHYEAEIHHATLTMPDAWGVDHGFEVEWRAEAVWDVALGHENIGAVPVIWVDAPPVYVARGNTGNVVLRKDVRQVAFDREHVMEASRARHRGGVAARDVPDRTRVLARRGQPPDHR